MVLGWQHAYDALDKYGYLGGTVQEILDGITYRTEEIVKENAEIEKSIKSIENQLDTLKTKYDAATASAKALASANNAAAASANNLAASKAVASTQQYAAISPGGNVDKVFGSQTEAQQYVNTHYGEDEGAWVRKYHTGTNYVKKANSWLDSMLGLGPNETAAILKKGEAVIPDYDNPSNPSSNFSYGKMAESMSKAATYSSNNTDQSASVVIGDIIINGNTTEDIVEKLNKVRKEIVSDVFFTINKHTNIAGYRNVKHSY